MSFAQSIIIPLSLFKRCQFDKINSNENNEISKKVMLHDQEKLLKEKIFVNKNDFKFDHNDILIHINKMYKPQIKAILEKIQENPQTFSIDKKTFEVSINGKKIINSNIIKILQYFAKSKIVTKESDIPTGSKLVYYALVNDLKIPSQWIPNKKISETTTSRTDPEKRTRASVSDQQGSGWVICE